MAQLTITLPDDKVAFFTKVVAQFGFAATPVKETAKPKKKYSQDALDIVADIKEAMKEVEAHRRGEIELPTIEQVMAEMWEEHHKHWGGNG